MISEKGVKFGDILWCRVPILLSCLALSDGAGPGAGEVRGQEPESRYDFLLGSWEGELEYLDYGDNETRVTLPTWLVVKRSDIGPGLEASFLFEEPDGSTVEGGDRFYETREGLVFGELWAVDSWESPAPDGTHRIALSRQGLDDERPAMLWTVIERSKDRLTLTKTVRYGDGAVFQRNQFRFQQAPVEP